MRILTPTSISNSPSSPTIDAKLHIHDADATTGDHLLILSSDDSDYYFKVASNGRVHFRGNSTIGDGQIKVHLQHSGFVGAASSMIWDSSSGVNQMSIRQSEENSDLFIYAHSQSLNLAEFARTTADVTFNAKTTINGQGGDILDLYDNDATTPVNVMKVKDDGVVHLRNTTYSTSMDIHNGSAIVTGGSVVIGIDAIDGADFTPTSLDAGNSWNTIVGYQAAKDAVSKNGGYITAIGAGAGEGSQGNYCVYLGNGAGRLMDHGDTDRNSNIAIGVGAMYLGLNEYGVAIGHEAGRNAYGENNIHIGFEAGENVGTSVKGSDDNVIIGYQAGKDSDSADSVLVGALAGYNSGTSTRSNRNVYVGRRSGYEANGGWNVYLGDETGETTIGDNNTFLGSNIAFNSNVNGTGEMDGNVAIGYNAFGVANIGGWTGITEGTMTNNIVIGHGTCAAVTMASGNVVIGANLLIGDTDNLSNTVVIGSDGAERLRIHSTGQFKFNGYEEFESDGTTPNTDFESTPVKALGVDTDGNVVKFDAASGSGIDGTGATNQVAFFTDSDTLASADWLSIANSVSGNEYFKVGTADADHQHTHWLGRLGVNIFTGDDLVNNVFTSLGSYSGEDVDILIGDIDGEVNFCGVKIKQSNGGSTSIIGETFLAGGSDTVHYGTPSSSETTGHTMTTKRTSISTATTTAIHTHLKKVEQGNLTMIVDYTVRSDDGTAMRTGRVTGITDGTSVSFTDVTTASIGDTSSVGFGFDIETISTFKHLRLNAITTSSDTYHSKYILNQF